MGTGITAKLYAAEGGGERNWIPFRFVRRATRLDGYRASPTGGVYVGQGIPLRWTVSFIAEGDEEGKGVL